MLLGERIKDLRKEAGWSQGELADKVATDARQISRYENGRITPSLDVIARIAEALNISLDHLIFEDIPRRPLHTPDHGLGHRLADIGQLNPEDRTHILSVIDAYITKNRLHTLTARDN